MNATDWTEIPGRLKEAGFAVVYERISYDVEHPLWCARASRGGRKWSTLGKSLCLAFVELERQTFAAGGNWRDAIAHEMAARTSDLATCPRGNGAEAVEMATVSRHRVESRIER